ncbi:MFS efflux pump atnC [Beauveria bassiana]|nr:MFS efflux pump atnC [Beauveria bassiana]
MSHQYVRLEGSDAPVDDEPTEPDQSWTRDSTYTLSLMLLVSTLYVFSDISRYLACLKLLSQIICQEHYLKHDDPSVASASSSLSEDMCAVPAVQQRLAHISGNMLSLGAALNFIFTIPYGLMLDRLSERLVIALNVTGFVCSSAWLVVVFWFSSLFPVEAAVVAPIFSAIGGGYSVFDSVTMVIVVRHVPKKHRSLCFGFFLAAALLTQAVSLSLTGSLLEGGYLFTPILLNFPLGILAVLLVVMMPSGAQSIRSMTAGRALLTWPLLRQEIKSTVTATGGLVSDPRGLGLLLVVPLAKMADPLTEVILLYVQKRFGNSFAYASRVLTFQTMEGLVLLAGVIPLLNMLLQKRFHMPSTKVDQLITRSSFALLGVGALVMGISQTWFLYMIGIMVFTLGWSAGPALKSVLTDMVSPHNIAALYTLIALCDSVGTMVGPLIFNRSYALATGWADESFMGLPFLLASGLFLLGGLGTLVRGRQVSGAGEWMRISTVSR